MKPIKLISLCVTLFCSLGSLKAYEGFPVSRSYQSFEKKQTISLDKWKGNVSIASDRSKDGNRSLKWNAVSGATLEINPNGLKEALKSKNGGIQCWIYNDKLSNDTLQFNVIDNDGNKVWSWGLKLNYKGWQAMWIHFYQQAFKGVSYNRSKEYKIVAVNGNEKRSLYFDNFEFVRHVIGKHTDDAFYVSRPMVNEFGTSHPWTYTKYWDRQQIPDLSKKPSDYKERLESIQKIEQRYRSWVLPGHDKKSPNYIIREKSLQQFISQGVDKLNNYNIKVKNGVITGTPLYSIRGENKPFFADLSMSILLPLALDYLYNGNQKSGENYLLALNYMHDQGWRAGSALGSIDHEMLRHSGYFHSIFLMKDLLKKEGILEREMATAKWYLNWNELYHLPPFVGCTADFMRTLFMYRLLVVFMEDGPAKVNDMYYYHQWIEKSMSIAPGFSDTFKPDYVGYHHRGVYMNAYGPNAFHMASVISWMLDGSAYSLSDQSMDNLTQSVVVASKMNYRYHIPMGVCGRFPHNDANYINIVPSLAYLLHTQKGATDEVKSEYLRTYPASRSEQSLTLMNRADSKLEYLHTLGAVSLMEDAYLKVKNLAKEENHRSVFTFKPYAGLGLYRVKDIQFSVKGWSAYIWDFEGGKKGENLYGRYLSYGGLQSYEPTPSVIGFDLSKGFDWNHIPGTTSKVLPLKTLKFGKHNKFKHRNFTDQTFLSGLDNNDKGWVGIKLHDTVFDPSFYANKSYLFLPNRILCMGDQITSKDKDNSCVTTIFQRIDEKNHRLKLNGKYFTSKDTTIISKKAQRVQFEDGLTYWVAPNQELHIQHRMVTNPKGKKKKKKKNRAMGVKSYIAWLSHDKAPSNGRYHYEIQWSDKKLKPMKHVTMNKSSHQVVDGKTTYYHIWNADSFKGDKMIGKVSDPISLSLTKEKHSLQLSLTDPDMRRPMVKNIGELSHEKVIAPSVSKQVKIYLKGRYRLSDNAKGFKILSKKENETVVAVDCIDGRTYKTELIYE